ncbi:MAG: nucleotide exchange factor GrpE [Alphaproteobacteria bacterium]|jgi:molecular chaperone GrpE|nr:nucleotide exchange factor GrpE [Alphaproteobacteria bacterium]MDP6517490.1 nucleotide exchange factor GrpE [Alphaproteobacteria bacterium]|tara:strand:- start:951 stop:1556 length:606 start_codon:yes stop_codon:yes gene_type:complete
MPNQKTDLTEVPPEADAAQPADAATDAATPEEDPSVSEEERLAGEVATLKDQLLRALAEVENLRRRSARELEEANKFSIANFARDMTGVADNLERALASLPRESLEGNEPALQLCEGVEMTRRELAQAFERQSIERIDPLGEAFDHNLHQAMFEVPDSGEPPGTVVQVIQHGYRIHDRLLRPAMVGLAGKTSNEARIDTEA